MLRKFKLLLPILAVLAMSACAQEEASRGRMDYEETKKMVVDILKTDEGKKAIQDLMADDQMKQQLIMDNAVITDTVEKTLVSEKGRDFWKKSFEDPKFSEAVAKSMKTHNEQLMKDLMKDPEYQGMLVSVFKDPELQKEVTDYLKGREYREHLQKLISETFENPLYKVKFQEILLKAAEEMQSKGGGQEKQSQSDGGQGGDGSEQGGGGS